MLPHVEALVIRGGNHPEDRLQLLYGKARMLAQRRKFPEATALFEQVIALSDGMGNEWRTPGANARAELGEILLQLEDYPAAVERMRGALVALQAIFGAHHPRILIALANLALAQSKVDGEGALATLAEMRALSATLPSEDWRAVTIPFLEGQVREDRGDCAAALPFYREAFERFTTTYGAGASQVADVHARLAACSAALGRRAEALSELERALEIRREKGEAPSAVARAAFELARALMLGAPRATQRARALELGEEARALWREDGVAEKAGEVEAWLARARGAAPASPGARAHIAKK